MDVEQADIEFVVDFTIYVVDVLLQISSKVLKKG